MHSGAAALALWLAMLTPASAHAQDVEPASPVPLVVADAGGLTILAGRPLRHSIVERALLYASRRVSRRRRRRAQRRTDVFPPQGQGLSVTVTSTIVG